MDVETCSTVKEKECAPVKREECQNILEEVCKQVGCFTMCKQVASFSHICICKQVGHLSHFSFLHLHICKEEVCKQVVRFPNPFATDIHGSWGT